MNKAEQLHSIMISLASPELVRKWSYGEVTKSDTINYKNYKPAEDGLFCQKIFGPVKQYECACGRYKRENNKGIVCEKCGVEVTKASVRRERMGHIELAAPIAHYWFFKGNRGRNYLTSLLNIPSQELNAVLYCDAYLVTHVDDENEELPFKKFDLLTINDYEAFKMKYYRKFEAGTGGEVIKGLLEKIDLKELNKTLEEDIKITKGAKRDSLKKRRRDVVAFLQSGNRPEWMIIDALPVIPPEMRPMVQIDGGRFATSDLNDLYRRILVRNSRLKRLLELGAPDIIVNNEKKLVQDAVDALIANDKKKNPATHGAGRRVLKSLAESLSSKQGLFRQNLLGKRVDYSGRSVITVGPEMSIDECGIPRKMAIELFAPFVIREIIRQGYCETVESAKKRIKANSDEIWDILEQVSKNHPVLLNRAPTLHKLSIRAFNPIIVEGQSIRLHPLVTPGFNADFDGDQMAVHLPLSDEAQTEARVLMMASENLLHPQNGESAITPSQDMVLGTYYISIVKEGGKGEGRAFLNEEEAIRAYDFKKLDLHSKIILSIENNPKFSSGKYLVTTVGKILFNREMPKKLVYINDAKILDKPEGVFDSIKEAVAYLPTMKTKEFGKDFLQKLIGYSFDRAGSRQTAVMADGIKNIGFKYATKGGLTISLFDISVPDTKEGYLKKAEETVQDIEALYRKGRLTADEKYNLVVEEWSLTSEKVVDDAMSNLKSQKENPIFMMIDSKARGSRSQFGQLAGMRGLMANPKGEIIERPIKASFSEGLSVLEFFIATHGARKGMADTSLKTADAGYLTRRLVDVAHKVVITEEDCGTDEAYYVSEIPSDIESLRTRITGRYLAKDLIDDNGELIAEKDTLVNEELAIKIEEKFDSVPIRNLFICRSTKGACQKCYGQNLATRNLVDIGEPVGIVAAQSIGEPGTQLTMRTFHSGGVAGNDITQGLPRVEEVFEGRISKKSKKAYLSQFDGVVTEVDEKRTKKEIFIKTDEGEMEVYSVPYQYSIFVREGDRIQKGDVLTSGTINTHELLELTNIQQVQEYLLAEIQRVYGSQGVAISDKHIEVIVRQMTRKALVTDSGDSTVMEGKLMDRMRIEKRNRKLLAAGKKPIEYLSTILGVTKAASSSESFLSAASFQETSKALTNAAVLGKKDKLRGLKEAVIAGKLIPAGTGSSFYYPAKQD